MENVDGMVGGLRQLVDDANITFGLDGCCCDDALEGSLVDGLRAAEGEQQATFGDAFDGFSVDELVAT